MALCLYQKDEPGFEALDLNLLTNEQAIEIADLIHKVALRHSCLRDVVFMSTRLMYALSWLEPKIVTVDDLLTFPLHKWRMASCMNRRIYDELREVVRPIKIGMPPWRELP